MTLDEYFKLVDELRERRAAPGWQPSQDRDLLAVLDDGYMTLSSEEQDEVERQGDRWWPKGKDT